MSRIFLFMGMLMTWNAAFAEGPLSIAKSKGLTGCDRAIEILTSEDVIESRIFDLYAFPFWEDGLAFSQVGKYFDGSGYLQSNGVLIKDGDSCFVYRRRFQLHEQSCAAILAKNNKPSSSPVTSSQGNRSPSALAEALQNISSPKWIVSNSLGNTQWISIENDERSRITLTQGPKGVCLEPISKLNRHLFEEHMACRNMRISREIVTAAAGDFHVQGPYFDFEIGSRDIRKIGRNPHWQTNSQWND